jgi:hypothetical protein
MRMRRLDALEVPCTGSGLAVAMHDVHIVLHVVPGTLLSVLRCSRHQGRQNPGCHGRASQTPQDQDNH